MYSKPIISTRKEISFARRWRQLNWQRQNVNFYINKVKPLIYLRYKTQCTRKFVRSPWFLIKCIQTCKNRITFKKKYYYMKNTWWPALCIVQCKQKCNTFLYEMLSSMLPKVFNCYFWKSYLHKTININ